MLWDFTFGKCSVLSRGGRSRFQPLRVMMSEGNRVMMRQQHTPSFLACPNALALTIHPG